MLYGEHWTLVENATRLTSGSVETPNLYRRDGNRRVQQRSANAVMLPARLNCISSSAFASRSIVKPRFLCQAYLET